MTLGFLVQAHSPEECRVSVGVNYDACVAFYADPPEQQPPPGYGMTEEQLWVMCGNSTLVDECVQNGIAANAAYENYLAAVTAAAVGRAACRDTRDTLLAQCNTHEH